MQKIKSFTHLNTWKEGHKLVLHIYDVTKKFPSMESYGLIDQMRRAAVSITSNIAEGFSRQSKKEKLKFYYISKGSLTEIQNQLIIAKDIKYISSDNFNKIAENTVIVGKLLSGLIKSAKTKK